MALTRDALAVGKRAGTLVSKIDAHNIAVLNAFRHHRNSHLGISAVSLSISRCSTPFGIIGILTHLDLVQSVSEDFVLNAFRHHRNSHPNPALLATSYQNVLNAFRHHRNSHSLITDIFPTIDRCSTPFGIIGILTPISP
jgi:hypothetical protein